MNTVWFFLPGIIYLGLVSSYTDIKHGKIMNKNVVFGITYAFVVYFAIAIYFLLKGQLNYYYFLELGSNALFALAVAFGLWDYKIWSAGDGKLFFAFALLIPPEIYQYGGYKWVPSITLLFNVFIIGLLAMLFLIIKNARLTNYKKMFSSFFRNFFEPKQLFNMIVSLFAIFWLVKIVMSWIGLGNNLLLRYALTILVISKLPAILSKFKPKKSKIKITNISLYAMVSITVLRFVVDKSVYSFQFLWSFLVLIFVWKLIRGVFRQGAVSLGQDIFSREIPVSALKQEMILSGSIVKVNKLSKKEIQQIAKNEAKVINKGKFSYIIGSSNPSNDYLGAESEGLTKEHIKKIKNIGLKKVRISSTIPFAPFMFLGAFLTIIANGNILIVVMNLT